MSMSRQCAAGGGGHRQGPKRQITLTRVDATEVYHKLHNFVSKKDLKGQCHVIFDHFFLKDLTWATYEQAKMVSRTFSFFS